LRSYTYIQHKCRVRTRSEDLPAPPRLLDQVRERARYLHYSLRTEKAYVYWVRMFVRWSGMRHPRDMGEPEVKAFLTMLASQRRVSSSTHNQALSAVLFCTGKCWVLSCPGWPTCSAPRARAAFRPC
jgi:hypothetical protein